MPSKADTEWTDLRFEPAEIGVEMREQLGGELALLLERASPVLLAYLWRVYLPDRPEPLTARLHAQVLSQHLVERAAAPRRATTEAPSQAGAPAEPANPTE